MLVQQEIDGDFGPEAPKKATVCEVIRACIVYVLGGSNERDGS